MASTSAAAQDVLLYPAYIDVNKSCGQGRRVPLAKAVPRPDVREMYDAIVNGLQLEAGLEGKKRYSRDALTAGRVRVHLKHSDGRPVIADIASKSVLLVKVAELCARHKDRPQRIAHLEKIEAQAFSGGGPVPHTNEGKTQPATASSAKLSARSNKKKGKRK